MTSTNVPASKPVQGISPSQTDPGRHSAKEPALSSHDAQALLEAILDDMGEDVPDEHVLFGRAGPGKFTVGHLRALFNQNDHSSVAGKHKDKD